MRRIKPVCSACAIFDSL
jgi:hypothetical protein